MSTDLHTVAQLIDVLGAAIDEWPDGELGGHALAYAAAGWEVFPLHPSTCRCLGATTRPGCDTAQEGRGKRPHTAHGVLDATTDLGQVADWWQRWPDANIGGRVPAGVAVIDIDPRHDGDTTWATLTATHGDFTTRTAITGRGDNGRHLYVAHPGGTLNGSIGAGIDVKTHAGYVVLPPSQHAAGGRYRWLDPLAPFDAAPAWLAALMRRTPPVATQPGARRVIVTGGTVGDSIADWYSDHHTWNEILGPAGWQLVGGDGDSDRSTWRHPKATSAQSATIRHGCLFVYTPNTEFEQTGASAPHGYTRFRAWAILAHGGDLSAAARAASDMRRAS